MALPRIKRPYPPSPDEEQPLLTHLLELRSRLMHILACVVLLFIVLAPFANHLYTLVAQPLLTNLPVGGTMIATDVISPMLIPFKFAFFCALFLSVPYILYQVWGFVAPALHGSERRLLLPLLVSSVFLFYLGMAFAYFVVFPMVFSFVTATTPVGVAVMTDITKYLDFVLVSFLAFGAAFEVPIATILLVWTGITTAEKLVAVRSYVIVGAFVIGMLLTPPDVISQTMMAIPIWLLFELGVVCSRFFVRKPQEVEEREQSPQ